jgi:hypothetical protein
MHRQHNGQFRFATLPRYPSLNRFTESRDCRFYVQFLLVADASATDDAGNDVSNEAMQATEV